MLALDFPSPISIITSPWKIHWDFRILPRIHLPCLYLDQPVSPVLGT